MHVDTENQNNLDKEQSWRIHICQFQNLLQSYTNQAVWHCPKYRQIDQWNRFEGLEITLYIYGQLIFD